MSKYDNALSHLNRPLRLEIEGVGEALGSVEQRLTPRRCGSSIDGAGVLDQLGAGQLLV